ncbi:MAG: ABC transporter substrate-binding protein [Alphaproteobacteria bacterium GM202ARS2]|nr:ABC transporter substrate-binding protein [Alphaproteobacteria bacterium GM202ARS2]
MRAPLRYNPLAPVAIMVCAGFFMGVALFVVVSAEDVSARALSQEELDERIERDKERRRKRQERQKEKGTTLQKKVTLTVPIGILVLEKDIPPALSNLDPIIQREGFDGARLAIEDNLTTGRFIGHDYSLEKVFVGKDEDPVAAFLELAQKTNYIIVAVPKELLLQLADLPQSQSLILFNIAAQDDSLRNEACRDNVFHIIPSRAMRADALAQFLLRKRWTKWFVIRGVAPEDDAFVAALQRAANTFGINIVEEKTWDKIADIRRTAKAEVPLFTKTAPQHDVMILADEQGLFGEFILWHSWQPRLVAGTQGLRAVSWHRNHERWGAIQMQSRFRRQTRRWMGEWDYGAWVAVRAIGETITRIQKDKPKDVKDYLRSDAFAIAAYKGIKVTFRPWNGQLRQRILLSAPRSMVSVAPQEGFLHPRTPLDTLGYDRPASTCNLNPQE